MNKIIAFIALVTMLTSVNAQENILSRVKTFEKDGPAYIIFPGAANIKGGVDNPNIDEVNSSAKVCRVERKKYQTGKIPASSFVAVKTDKDAIKWKGVDFSKGATTLKVKVMSNAKSAHNIQIMLRKNGDPKSYVWSPLKLVISDGAWHEYKLDLSKAIAKKGEKPVGFYDFVAVHFRHKDKKNYVDGEVFYVDDIQLTE